MVKERYSNIWPNQTIVSDQSELTILLCQLMNSLLLMKTTLPWYSGLQLLPSYIDNPWARWMDRTELHQHIQAVLWCWMRLLSYQVALLLDLHEKENMKDNILHTQVKSVGTTFSIQLLLSLNAIIVSDLLLHGISICNISFQSKQT